MKHADWIEILEKIATKHDLLLSDALINFAEDVKTLIEQGEMQ